MQIETYEIEEIKGELGVMAADSEAIELIEKLGLKGQQKLSDKSTDTRFPYPKLSALEALVYGTVFPSKTKVEDYSSGIIPLRILQVVAFVKDLPNIKRIEVWHPLDVRDKDPVLVAVEKHSQYEWADGERYILGRWGSALESLESLAQKAKKIWATATKSRLMEIRAQVDAEIASLDSIADAAFLDGKEKTYSFHAKGR